MHVLLVRGLEEGNWAKAKDRYDEIQWLISQGDKIKLYGETMNIIPDHITPLRHEVRVEELWKNYESPWSQSNVSSVTSKLSEKRKRGSSPSPSKSSFCPMLVFDCNPLTLIVYREE